MFWKKRKSENRLDINETGDRRMYFRTAPPEYLPAEMKVEGRPVRIIDIGAGGAAFMEGDMRKDGRYRAVIKLAGCKADINVEITVIYIGPEGINHSYFSRIKEEDTDAIHKYVLEVQKMVIRERRKRKD